MGSPTITMRVAGLTLLGLLVLQAEGADISNTTRAASGRLWSMDTTNDLHQRIFTELKRYAQFCCEYRGNAPKDCEKMQLGYWAWLNQGMSEADMFVILDGMFNPADPFTNAEDICNGPGGAGDDFTPYFAIAPLSTNGNAHTEAVLLPRMKRRAQENTVTWQQPTNFFLYTRGSPCCTDNNGCLQKIFDFTYENIYPNQRNYHSMTVGFDRWYTNGGTPEFARKNFCNKVTKFKTNANYQNVDFYERNGLRFKKFSRSEAIQSLTKNRIFKQIDRADSCQTTSAL